MTDNLILTEIVGYEMKPTKKTIFYSVLFTVFLLTYMVTLSITDEYVKGLSTSAPFLLHYTPGLTRIVGFVSFWLSRRFISEESARKLTLLTALVLFLISSALLITGSNNSVSLTALFILSLSIGHLGGLIYYCMSIAFETGNSKGRMIGASCAASVLLQFIFTQSSSNAVQLIIASVLFILICYMLIRTPADFVLEDPLPYSDDTGNFKKLVHIQLLTIAVIVLICSLIACRTDIAFLSMSFDGSINIYSYPRLAMIPGYLLMGYVSDLKNRKFFGITFVCSILLSAVLVLMPFQTGGYVFFLSIYYFFISVYIFFYTYSFVSIAPRTTRPELWASLGRPLSDICVAPISFIMLKIGDETLNSSPIYYALYYFILLIILYIIISVVRIDPNLSPTESMIGNKSRTLDEWLSSYSLTPRENDVAHILIETELPIKAIAAELKISERSVYRYASSIYEKTGIDNRAGLVKQYLTLNH